MNKEGSSKAPRSESSGSTESETWPQIVRKALSHPSLKGKATLHQLYSIVERHPRALAGTNRNVRAKVRQVLEHSDEFVRVDRGTWAFSSKFVAKTLRKLRASRRRLYPRLKK